MTVLGLDTTSKNSSVAVLKDQEVILEYNFSSNDNLSVILIPTIDFVLKGLNLRLEDIDAIGVGIGPGLFTGIRVGLATMKGILFGQSKPLVPVVTLQALAYKCQESRRILVPLIDAKRHEVYVGCYRNENGKLEEVFEPELLSLEKMIIRLKDFSDLTFVGSGAELHNEFLKKNVKGCKIEYRSNFLASEIGRIAVQNFSNKKYITDPADLHPLYLRRPDAEANLEEKEKK